MDKNDIEPTVRCSNWVDLLRWRAIHQFERRAYTFLLDGATGEAHLTYGQLDLLARAIGALLQSQGAAGQRVLLLYPPGLDYIAAFFGCLYAGAVAVPVFPPKLTRDDPTLSRLYAIASDAQPVVALTTSPIVSMVEHFLAKVPGFPPMRWLVTDTVAPARADEWHDPAVQGSTLAFLQYTSGSTSVPKGVMVSHDNLLHNEALIQQAFELTDEVLSVSWLPLYHDMGLIGNVLQPLYTGFPCILMSPLDFLQKPFRWLQAISRYQATVSGAPNFAYDLCLRRITPEQRAMLDLRSWDLAYCGAEPIRAATLERFASTFEPCGFRPEAFFPCYGLAEATLFVTGGPRSAPPVNLQVCRAALEQNRVVTFSTEQTNTSTLVGCGKTWLEQRVVIADPETRIQRTSGQIGEVWVSGPGVAAGYWNKPEATEHTFGAYLADTGEGPFLRTGDLGFVQDGELFITSRLKDLIIIRGRNHAPQDIEYTAEKSHPALRPGGGAAFSVDGTHISGVDAGAGECLVIVHEVNRHYRDVDVEQVAAALRQAVAETHELQVYAVVLVKAGSIPKTSSGKLQRQACRAKFFAGSLEQIGSSILEDTGEGADETSSERDESIHAALLASEPARRPTLLITYLRGELARMLQLDPARLEHDQPLTAFGLDSLKALELKNRIETDLAIEVPLARFVERPTIEQLAGALLEELQCTSATNPEQVPGAPISADPLQLLAQIDQLSDEQVDALIEQLQTQEVSR